MRKAWALFLFAAVMIVLTACGSNERQNIRNERSGYQYTGLYS